MKKLLLCSVAAVSTIISYGQQADSKSSSLPTLSTAKNDLVIKQSNKASKTTGLSDTLFYGSQDQFNGPYVNLVYDFAQPFDSGRLYGTNVANEKGFAQLYRYSPINQTAPNDTTYQIIGFVSVWGGTVQAASTKTVNFKVWSRSNSKTAIPGLTKAFVSGTPNAAALATTTVNATSLTLDGTSDNFTFLASPLSNVSYDVYVGYDINYTYNALAGDTLGLAATSTTNGVNTFTVETGTLDTLVNAANVVQNSAGVWKSAFFELGRTNRSQIIYPIIRLDCATCGPTSTKSVENNNLKFFGNYPNPANTSTNIRISLKKATDVTVTVADLNGRTIQTITKTLGMGEQIIPIETSALATGNYVYVIRTKDGDGIASTFSVAR